MRFTIADIEKGNNTKDPRFQEARIRCFATGETAHTTPIPLDVLKKGLRTIHNIPVVWAYSAYYDDAMGHEKDEVPCGFVYETYKGIKNAVTFEDDEDGRTFMVVDALLWKKFSKNLIDIFKRTGGVKSVSMEMTLIEGYQRIDGIELIDYTIQAITIIGERHTPAVDKSTIDLQFTKDQQDFIKDHVNIIEINNDINFTSDNKWINPRGTLFRPLSKASNSNELFNEAYLMFDNTIEGCLYPHHIVVDNRLILHKRGLQFAFQKIVLEKNINEDAILHLSKHFKDIGMNENNYSNFQIGKLQFEQYFAKLYNVKKGDESLEDLYFSKFTYEQLRGLINVSLKDEKEDNCDWCKYYIKDLTEEVVYLYDNESKEIHECKYVINDNEVVVDLENYKNVIEGFVELTKEEEEQRLLEMGCGLKNEDDGDGEDPEGNPDDQDPEPAREDYPIDYEKMVFELKEENEKLKEANAKFKADNEVYMSTIDGMKDYEALKAFKVDFESSQEKELLLSNMKEILNSIESKGISFTKENKDSLIDKYAEFSSIEGWSNYVKAQVFDTAESLDGLITFALPTTQADKSVSIWDKVKDSILN